ncbi:hypothetical protein ACQPZF_03600 [Actinosynnema sp. CS-041913]
MLVHPGVDLVGRGHQAVEDGGQFAPGFAALQDGSADVGSALPET